MTINGSARWYILSQNRSQADQFRLPAVCMPETGNQPSVTANSQMNTMAMMNTGRLYPTMVPTCTATSRLLPRLTAQKMPSGMVIPRARIVAKILMNTVFFMGSISTSTTGWPNLVELPRLPWNRPL